MPDISTIKDLPDISFIEYKTVDDVKTSMVADYEAYMTEATGKPYTLPRVSRDRFKLYAAAAQIYQAMKYVDIKGKMEPSAAELPGTRPLQPLRLSASPSQLPGRPLRLSRKAPALQRDSFSLQPRYIPRSRRAT